MQHTQSSRGIKSVDVGRAAAPVGCVDMGWSGARGKPPGAGNAVSREGSWLHGCVRLASFYWVDVTGVSLMDTEVVAIFAITNNAATVVYKCVTFHVWMQLNPYNWNGWVKGDACFNILDVAKSPFETSSTSGGHIPEMTGLLLKRTYRLVPWPRGCLSAPLFLPQSGEPLLGLLSKAWAGEITQGGHFPSDPFLLGGERMFGRCFRSVHTNFYKKAGWQRGPDSYTMYPLTAGQVASQSVHNGAWSPLSHFHSVTQEWTLYG